MDFLILEEIGPSGSGPHDGGRQSGSAAKALRNIDPQEAAFRVLGSDEGLSRARLFLVGVLADVLREGLALLGIEAVESM